MTATALAPATFDIGKVVKTTFGVVGRNWKTLGLLGLLLQFVPYAIYLSGLTPLMTVGLTAGADPGAALPPNLQSTVGLLSVGGLAMLIGAVLAQAGMLHAAIADLNGRRASFGDCLSTGLRLFFPLLGLGILMAVGLMIGFALLIVPGFLLLLAWLVATPALVAERTGVIGAFTRSRHLTRGHRGALFLLLLVFFALSIAVSIVASLFSGSIMAPLMITTGSATVLPPQFLWPSMLISGLAQMVQTIFFFTAIAVAYIELRTLKEGVTPASLAAVFD